MGLSERVSTIFVYHPSEPEEHLRAYLSVAYSLPLLGGLAILSLGEIFFFAQGSVSFDRLILSLSGVSPGILRRLEYLRSLDGRALSYYVAAILLYLPIQIIYYSRAWGIYRRFVLAAKAVAAFRPRFLIGVGVSAALLLWIFYFVFLMNIAPTRIENRSLSVLLATPAFPFFSSSLFFFATFPLVNIRATIAIMVPLTARKDTNE